MEEKPVTTPSVKRDSESVLQRAEHFQPEWAMYRRDRVPTWEVPAALVWEFARENEDFGRLAAAAHASRKRPRALKDALREMPAVSQALIQPRLRAIWANSAFPGTPWVSLPKEVRRELARSWALDEAVPLRPALVWEAVEAGFGELLSNGAEGRPKGNRVAILPLTEPNEFPSETGVFALFVVDWRAEKSQIKNAFEEWLEKAAPSRDAPKIRIERNVEKRLRPLLKGLAVQRLKRLTRGTWGEIHAAVKLLAGEVMFREQKKAGGGTHFSSYRAAQKQAEEFLRGFSTWPGLFVPMESVLHR